jgi:hypothetical protein
LLFLIHLKKRPMHKLKKFTFTVFVSLFVTLPLSRNVFSQDLQTKSGSVPAPQKVTATLAEKSLVTPLNEYNAKEANLRGHHLPGPITEAPEELMLAAPPPSVPATDILPTPRAATLLMNRALSDAETNNITSTVNEPSVAVRGSEILMTGNWFASFSTDGGSTFSYMNPSTSFPSIPGQPFCCDQVAIYDPGHDLMIWFLQYVEDGDGNTVRVAVAKGNDIATQQWQFYDFSPQGIGGWNEEWFDYPDLAVSDDFLYVTTNTFSTPPYSFTRAVILRLPLAELSAYQPLNFDYFETNQGFSFRPTQGATGTMYFGSNVSTNSVRVYTWPESSNTISVDDVAVQVWNNVTRVAPGPDGRDWLGRVDQRISGAWASGDNIGFAWTAAQDNNYPFPHVRVVIMNRNTKTVTAQPHIWNESFAYAYPATAPNNNGMVGISVSYGGGSQLFPSHVVGVFENSTSTWDLVPTANGTHGPDRNVWGDYLAVRPHGSQLGTWVATGFTLQGGTGGNNVVPRYIHFGQGGAIPLQLTLENLDPDNRLKKGETLEVRATVKRNGVPASGETVTFSSANTGLAALSATSGITDANGEVEVSVRGEVSWNRNTTTITATTGNITKSVPVKVPDLSVFGFLLMIMVVWLMNIIYRRSKLTKVNKPRS